MKPLLKFLVKTILATCGELWLAEHCNRESTRLRTNCDPLLACPRPPSTLRIHFTLSFPQPGSVEVQGPHIFFVIQLPSFFTSILSGLWGCTAWQTCTKLYGVTSQNTVIFIVPPWRSEIGLLIYVIVYVFFKETPNKSV